MKKIVAMLLMLTMLLTAAASAEETFTFKMGFDAEYPPYTYLGCLLYTSRCV